MQRRNTRSKPVAAEDKPGAIEAEQRHQEVEPAMKHRSLPVLLGLGMLLTGMTTGCSRSRVAEADADAPVIPVSHPVKRKVTDYVDFTGRTDAVNSVGIRARVTGYIVKTPFKEGAEVKKGDLLFEIDPRPYKAQLDQAQGQVNLSRAQLTLARATYDRDVQLGPKGAVSQQQLDQDKAAVDEARARIKAAQASMEIYKLNLSFTRITAPIDGQVSRYYLTTGNLVNQDQTLLTTVVSPDPMYAYFDVDELTVLRVKRAINEGKIKLPKKGAAVPVLMGLQGEAGFPHRGTINFVNNVLNPSTGTMAFRGVFANPKPRNGTRLLAPGMFVRIRLPIGQPYSALLVVDRALGSDQGLKFVYVVDKDNKVQYRRVRTGPLQEDGLRVIEEGLKPEDWVVVGGLQQVRPRMQVKVEHITMPVFGTEPTVDIHRPQPPAPGEQRPRQQPGAKGASQAPLKSKQIGQRAKGTSRR
jgi:multidrug efflux system membrane fusion protein